MLSSTPFLEVTEPSALDAFEKSVLDMLDDAIAAKDERRGDELTDTRSGKP